MSSEIKRILFVSHVGDRNGAPLVLLEIIKEIKKAYPVPFDILVGEGEELLPEFRSVGTTYLWKVRRHIRSGAKGLIASLYYKLVDHARQRYILHRLKPTTHVLLNTIVNGEIQRRLVPYGAKFICYVHELESAIYNSTSPLTLKTVLSSTHRFIAGSQSVRQNLIQNHQVAPGKVGVIYASIPKVSRHKGEFQLFSDNFRTKNRIPEGTILIGTLATNEWRKGFDLVLPLILLYAHLFPLSNVRFIWKGFRKNVRSSYNDLYDFEKFSLRDKLIILEHGSDNSEIMSCLDIFLLPSREDPYPLVVLEAASFGIPTVSFENAGGSPEFIGNDCGFTVPYGDLFQMAQRLNELAENRLLREKLGGAAQAKVGNGHDSKAAAAEVIRTLEATFFNS